MKRNLLLIVLIAMVVIALPYATWYRSESQRLARIVDEIQTKCEEIRTNAQMERDRQYELARQLAAENEALKQRLKDCRK